MSKDSSTQQPPTGSRFEECQLLRKLQKHHEAHRCASSLCIIKLTDVQAMMLTDVHNQAYRCASSLCIIKLTDVHAMMLELMLTDVRNKLTDVQAPSASSSSQSRCHSCEYKTQRRLCWDKVPEGHDCSTERHKGDCIEVWTLCKKEMHRSEDGNPCCLSNGTTWWRSSCTQKLVCTHQRASTWHTVPGV